MVSPATPIFLALLALAPAMLASGKVESHCYGWCRLDPEDLRLAILEEERHLSFYAVSLPHPI